VHFDSSTHGYNVLEITPTQLICRMQPVNPIDTQEGAKGNPSIFLVLQTSTRSWRPVRDQGGRLGPLAETLMAKRRGLKKDEGPKTADELTVIRRL
jgi:hypothetical protein